MCTVRYHRVVTPAADGRIEVEDALGRCRIVSLLAWQEAPPVPGEWIVAHSGYALERADAQEARRAVEELRSIGPARRAGGPR